MSILANLIFLNQVLQRISRERNMLVQAFAARGDSLTLRVVSMLFCNSASTGFSLMLVFWLYYWVVGWDVDSASFGSVVNSMLSMKILMDIMAVFGTVSSLYLSQAAAVGVTGFWLGWNVIFAGYLIRLQDLWVIWSYWSAYVHAVLPHHKRLVLGGLLRQAHHLLPACVDAGGRMSSGWQ